MKTLKQNQNIYFRGEELPMRVAAINELFAVCVRNLDKVHDAELLEFEVTRGAYLTVEEAYFRLMDEVVYTCLSFKTKTKGPHNLVFNLYDFGEQESIESLLDDLTTGNVSISERRQANFEIDFIKTFN